MRFFFKIDHPIEQSYLDNLVSSLNNQFNDLIDGGEFKRNFLAAHEAIVKMHPNPLINKDSLHHYKNHGKINCGNITFLIFLSQAFHLLTHDFSNYLLHFDQLYEIK